MIVVLLGYMASGKSTIGKILAKKLNYRFIDLDLYIEEKEKRSITELFKNKGEIYFRKREAFYLNQLINNEDNIVLSLGGGTPCYGSNMEDLLNSNLSTSIYLKASIPSLVTRLQNERDQRPLILHLHSEELLTEFIGKHLFERSPFYNQADVTISTDDKNKKEILEEIIFKLF